MKKEMHIEFGALVPPIADQLCKQGLSMLASDLKRCQKLADALSDLFVAAVLTESEIDKARSRLMKIISKLTIKRIRFKGGPE